MRHAIGIGALSLLMLLVVPGCALEEDCPDCETECWEGPNQCTRCKKKHGCPLEATPDQEVDTARSNGGVA